jgi:2,4-dienoyl-CoA reductase-like NADH-dependent reductase (Old Yellow Enzyme family)
MDDQQDLAGAPPLFQPLTLRGVTFRNRVVVSPMCQYSAIDGFAGDWHFVHHGRFALGGVGGAIVEATAVTRDGRITPGCLGLWHGAQIAGLRRIVALYHAQRVPVGIQLAHAGRKASAAVPLAGAAPLATCDPPAAWRTVAPSALPYGEQWPVPHQLTSEEVEELVEAFARAAHRAVDAGFDFVEIHGAHGYLVHSFLAAVSNRRDDEWGGNLQGRMRFPLRVATAIRATVPKGMPVFWRASVEDPVAGGMTREDTITTARALKAVGVDLVDCSTGGITAAAGPAPTPGYLAPNARAVRTAAGLPTMAVGLITTPALANGIIADGSADLVALGRELLANPNFTYHAALALGHPAPHDLLPEAYAFYLRRRAQPGS